ncbi:hypothetical protein GCM10028797_08780 [Dyella agri]
MRIAAQGLKLVTKDLFADIPVEDCAGRARHSKPTDKTATDPVRIGVRWRRVVGPECEDEVTALTLVRCEVAAILVWAVTRRFPVSDRNLEVVTSEFAC